MTTSAACSRTFSASAEIFTPQGASLAPTTAPRSRPTFAGSVSMAPQISMACFSRIRRAMDAPIGPTPYWMARIFFFKVFSVFHSQQARHRAFWRQENLTIKEIRGGGNAKRRCRRAIRDDALGGTWELELGYALVEFRSSHYVGSRSQNSEELVR